MQRNSWVSRWMGTVPYSDGLEIQRTIWFEVVKGQTGVVLGLEHDPVITLGKRSVVEQDVLGSTRKIRESGVGIVAVDRGGHATLHGPGQLVIYPILPLRKWQLSVREFVHLLEETTLSLLTELGVVAFRRHEPGLYTQRGKIAFLGLRVEQGVSRHGLALNVNNDLGLFRMIRSCGLNDESFDRLIDHDQTLSTSDIFAMWTAHFRATLGLTERMSSDYLNDLVRS